MVVRDRLYTASDLDALPDDGKRYELNQGELIIMPPPKREHGLVVATITGILFAYVRAHDLGVVVGEVGYQLSENPDTVRSPDVSFIAKGRISAASKGYDRTAPDLAVEVGSPGNTAEELNEKVAQYFAAGVRLVWILYSRTRTVHVYNSARTVTILGPEDTLTGGDILPGFAASVREIFAVLDASGS